MIIYTDQYAITHGDEGQPLGLGILVFCEPGTTEPRNVKDIDGNNIGSKVLLDAHGRVPRQVFCEGDYDVQVWRYIGPVYDPEEMENFEHVRTDRLVDPSIYIVSKIGGETTLGTIAELRAFSNAVEGMVVSVNGYNVAGDCPQRNYVWKAGSTASEDGGGVIKPTDITGAGRWLLVCPEKVDVRFFGVFPSAFVESVTYYGSSITAAAAYAASNSVLLLFPRAMEDTINYYGCDGIAVYSDIEVPYGVYLYPKPGTTNELHPGELNVGSDIEWMMGAEGSGDWKLYHKEYYTCWDNGHVTFYNYDRIVYNFPGVTTTYVGKHIHFVKNCDQTLVFNACDLTFEPWASLSGTKTFRNMVFKDEWMNLLDITNCTFHNCVMSVGNFQLASNYVKAALKNGDTLLDLGCKDVNMGDYAIGVDRVLEIRNGFLKAKFSNMSGGLTLTDMDTSLSSGSTFGSLAVNRGSIGFQLPQYSINVNDFFSASNCTVKNKVILSNGLNAVNINKCTIQGIEGYEVNIFDSIVQGEVKMYPTGGAWKGNLYRNTFLGDGCNVLTYKDSGSTDNKVQCAWVDNLFVGDRSLEAITEAGVYTFAYDESAHSYLYTGNRGNCPRAIEYNTVTVIGNLSEGYSSVNEQKFSSNQLKFLTFGVKRITLSPNPPTSEELLVTVYDSLGEILYDNEVRDGLTNGSVTIHPLWNGSAMNWDMLTVSQESDYWHQIAIAAMDNKRTERFDRISFRRKP